MVPGIDSFREKFKDYTDYYTILSKCCPYSKYMNLEKI